MRLTEWDREIGPRLAAIRLDCGWAKHYSKKVLERVRELPGRPGWPTEAGGRLDEAISEIEAVLSGLKVARKELSEKQIVE